MAVLVDESGRVPKDGEGRGGRDGRAEAVQGATRAQLLFELDVEDGVHAHDGAAKGHRVQERESQRRRATQRLPPRHVRFVLYTRNSWERFQ